ncbi:peptidylprolyl isomerase [Candidatus Woesearchaeota archaeon]|nr:peptidylprolyl isomerase [Candidatus Woesearchaeota archaeon]
MEEEPRIEIVDVEPEEHEDIELEEKPKQTQEKKVVKKKAVKKKAAARRVKKVVRKKEKDNSGVYIGVIVLLIIVGTLLYIFQDKIFLRQPKDTIIAKVNGEPIYASEFEKIYARLQVTYRGLVSRENALNQTIARILLLQDAEEKKISVNDSEIQESMDAIKAQIPAGQSLDAILAMQNLTLKSLETELRSQLLLNKLFEVMITQEDISEYYEENKDTFTAKEGEIRARHILVNSSQEAEEILAELKNGADFETLALEKSIDPTVDMNGGELGFFDQNMMVEEFSKAAFALKVGELSKPVKTSFGWHVIERETDVMPLEEVSSFIRQSLTLERVPAYINELKAKADIEIFEEKPPTKPAEEEVTADKVEVGLEENEEEAEATEQPAETFEVVSFKDTGNPVCLNADGKPIVTMFSTTASAHSKWISDSFDKVMKEYSEKIEAHHYQLDTGDDTLTAAVETVVPQKEREAFIKYNPDSSVPTFIFGCKYIRAGNYYETQNDIASEEKEFRAVLNALVK